MDPKAQMAAANGRVRVWFQSPRRSLGIPGRCSILPEVVQAYSQVGCFVGPAPEEVTGTGLLQWMTLLQVYPHFRS